jgi:hypothetical protein
LLSKIWTKIDICDLSPEQDLTMVSAAPVLCWRLALMAEALVDVALVTTIATADADNSRQQTTINIRIGAKPCLAMETTEVASWR